MSDMLVLPLVIIPLHKKGITQKASQNLLREKMHTPHHLIANTIILLPRDLHANVPHIGYESDI